jgi:predicted outer membrane repeat protein
MRKPTLPVAPSLLASATLTLLSLAAPPLLAATFFVDDNGAGAACTAVAPCPRIATAVGLSAAGDVVQVAAGTYKEWGIVIPHSLAVIGNSAATVTVDGSGNGPIFKVDPVVGLVLLSRMTLTNGDAGGKSGGAIRFLSGDLAITGSQLIGNSALGGGAVSHKSTGQLLILTSLLEDNTATDVGGAIVCDGCGGIDVRLSILRNNTAASTGGAIDINASTLSVFLSSISYNSAVDGGGIYALITPLTIYDGTLTGNSAASDGGALYSQDTVDIQRSTFAENTAGDNGGAAYVEGGDAVTVSNSTFSANSAFCGGAFALIDTGAGLTASLSATTLYDNVATFAACGGHFQSSATVLEVSNSIIDGGAGINCNAPMTGGTHNLIDDATCDTGVKGFDLGPVILLDPVLAYNGGPTQTHLIGAKSNAVEAGDKASCLNPATGAPLAMDQRTLSRPFDHDGDGTATCDIGAVELR